MLFGFFVFGNAGGMDESRNGGLEADGKTGSVLLS